MHGLWDAMTHLGWRYSGPVLWQGSAPWGSVPVGLGSETHGNVGCLSTSVAQLLRIMGSRAGATPLHVKEMATRTEGVYQPGHSGAVVTALVDAMVGLCAGRDVDGVGRNASVPDLQAAIMDALRRGGACLVLVDHDSMRPGGDVLGDHWLTAYAVDGDRLLVTDPASTGTTSLSWETLAGPSKWGRVTRDYRVTRPHFDGPDSVFQWSHVVPVEAGSVTKSRSPSTA